MSGSKERLTIRRINTQDNTVQDQPVFSAMFNPAKYTRNSAVFYTEPQESEWETVQQQKMLKKAQDTLDLDELVLDGTGIVAAPDGTGDVDYQINLLRQVLNDPAGDGNVINAVVDIAWGKLLFRGRIASMTVSYTLFDAAGKPLRARIKLSFVAYDQDTLQYAAGVARTLTRQIEAVEGASLPLLCFTAYGDPALVQHVADFNNLTTFRQVNAGAKITFPKFK